MSIAAFSGDEPGNPLLYQINTRVLLTRISRTFNRRAGFDDIPVDALHAIAALGFQWVWFLGVWQLGDAARAVSRTHAAWQEGFREALDDLAPEDISGSPFAIAAWHADDAFGGAAALARLRQRVNAAGLRLMLDFVPNHLAPDHPWVHDRPTLFMRGTEADLAADPENWMRVATAAGPCVLAHGRDPYFPGWPDTVQLDYSNPDTHTAMRDALLEIAGQCDGVRCDMAMLLLPEVFERCWGAHLHGRPVASFWQDAIPALRATAPQFGLLAEVYWNLEDELLGLGFDWAYDKGFYDALRAGDGPRVAALLARAQEVQARCARFLENHDEPRAAASFPMAQHKAAAVLSFCAPGLRLLHQGQLEGARIHIPIHLDRGPVEPIDPEIHEFYLDLLAALRAPGLGAPNLGAPNLGAPNLGNPVLRHGRFTMLPVAPAWEGNPSHEAFSAFAWSDETGPKFLCVVNYREYRGQCRVRLDAPSLLGRAVSLSDRLGPEHYSRDGTMLAGEGLYLDRPGWGYNLFAIA